MARPRSASHVATLAAMVLAGLPGLSLPPAVAQTVQATPTAASSMICGFAVSEAASAVWRDLGGETGRLGCATAPETPTATSPLGTLARATAFGDIGVVLLHMSGARAGQAYAVSGCAFRLYVQFGGSSGSLGLPLGDSRNTPDGYKQPFEGGIVRTQRALDACDWTRTAEETRPVAQAAATAQADGLADLNVYENPATGDRLSLAAAGAVAEAEDAGYHRLRVQGRVMTLEAAGETRLKLFVQEARSLRETVASAQSERDALADGFVFEAGQGWIWTDPRPGAAPLKLYRHPATARVRLAATPDDVSDAEAAGYRFVRIEGYLAPPTP